MTKIGKRQQDILHLTNELRTSLGALQDAVPAIPLLDDLIKFAEEISVAPTEKLLSQGDINENLYIILEGRLDVIIDNEIVSTLKRRGDIVGEMSIVSGTSCTADVVATSQTRLLKIPGIHIHQQRPEIKLHIYNILCLTLVSKLEYTNLKAKQFETLSRTLEEKVTERTKELEERNREVSLSLRRLEDVYRQNDSIIKNLANLREQEIQTSLNLLQLTEPAPEQVESARRSIDRVNQSLIKLENYAPDNRSLTGKKVLVVESSPRYLSLLKIALGGTGVETHFSHSIEEGKQALEKNHYNVIFLAAEFVELASDIRSLTTKSKIVLLSEEDSSKIVSRLKEYDFISSIIAKRQEDRAFNVKSISSTVKKMLTDDIFGLEKYLHWGTEIKQFEITSSTQRMAVSQKALGYMSDLGIRSSILKKCEMVIEELLMNAIYDAPVDKHGNQLYNSRNRNLPVELEAQHCAKLRIATDGLFLAVSVEDPFGAFSKKTIVDYLENNYYNLDDNFNVNQGKAGAGKGLYLITEFSDLVIYNISPGVRTEVIALFDLDQTKSASATSIHYFEI
jgi:CRP-like cAMP-binding protein/anti-sigma regulatory factor (Ser/Thr protein kinase)